MCVCVCVSAQVETPDNYGQSPLFMACWKGHARVARLLLELNANRDCRTKTGITPLFQVRKHSRRRYEVVECQLNWFLKLAVSGLKK